MEILFEWMRKKMKRFVRVHFDGKSDKIKKNSKVKLRWLWNHGSWMTTFSFLFLFFICYAKNKQIKPRKYSLFVLHSVFFELLEDKKRNDVSLYRTLHSASRTHSNHIWLSLMLCDQNAKMNIKWTNRVLCLLNSRFSWYNIRFYLSRTFRFWIKQKLISFFSLSLLWIVDAWVCACVCMCLWDE